MRKLLVAIVLCLSFTVCGCQATEMSTLSEYACPWTGEYMLEKLMLGDRDLTEEGQAVLLTLDRSGRFTLQTSEGGNDISGQYRVSEDEDLIYFSVGAMPAERSFPFENGKIYIRENLGGKLLFAVFSM